MIDTLKHICFDKDGVLIDVHAYWIHTTEIRANYLKEKLNLTSSQVDFLMEKMGIDLSKNKIRASGPVGYEPRDTIINTLKDALTYISKPLSKVDINKIFFEVDSYQQKNRDYRINLLEGVIDFLEKAKPKYKMTIFTSDRKKNTELTLDSLGISKYFCQVFGGDSVFNPKPSPEGINKICSNINISKKQTCYISDTTSDLIMAENAGPIYKIGVLSGLGLKNDLSKKADLICKNLGELKEHLK